MRSAQRLAEMKAEAAKKLIATDEVRQISKEMWQKEVTNAGDTYVLVHLFQAKCAAQTAP